jgi:hypothetical protein
MISAISFTLYDVYYVNKTSEMAFAEDGLTVIAFRPCRLRAASAPACSGSAHRDAEPVLDVS